MRSEALVRATRISTSCLALVGALYLISRGAFFLIAYVHSNAPAPEVAASLASPDDKFRVVGFDAIGGGGISPFCYYTFSVVPKGVPDNIAWKDRNQVASIPCSGLVAGGVGHGVTWLPEHRLKIVLDVTGALQGGLLILRPNDATTQVAIDYSTPHP